MKRVRRAAAGTLGLLAVAVAARVMIGGSPGRNPAPDLPTTVGTATAWTSVAFGLFEGPGYDDLTVDAELRRCASLPGGLFWGPMGSQDAAPPDREDSPQPQAVMQVTGTADEIASVGHCLRGIGGLRVIGPEADASLNDFAGSFIVRYVVGADYSHADDIPRLKACLRLPGAAPLRLYYEADPPAHTVRFTGSPDDARRFSECLSALPNSDVVGPVRLMDERERP